MHTTHRSSKPLQLAKKMNPSRRLCPESNQPYQKAPFHRRQKKILQLTPDLLCSRFTQPTCLDFSQSARPVDPSRTNRYSLLGSVLYCADAMLSLLEIFDASLSSSVSESSRFCGALTIAALQSVCRRGPCWISIFVSRISSAFRGDYDTTD
jgi:hypothetical protein